MQRYFVSAAYVTPKGNPGYRDAYIYARSIEAALAKMKSKIGKHCSGKLDMHAVLIPDANPA